MPRPQHGRTIFLGNLPLQSRNSSPLCSKSGLMSARNSICTAQSPGQGLFVLCHDFYASQSPSTVLSTAPQRCWINFLFHSCSSEPQLYQGMFKGADTASRQCCLHKGELWNGALEQFPSCSPQVQTLSWSCQRGLACGTQGCSDMDLFSTHPHIKWASLLQSGKPNVLLSAPNLFLLESNLSLSLSNPKLLIWGFLTIFPF